MVEQIPLSLPENPQLVNNITYFVRALRKAGIPIGPGKVVDAIRAVEAVGFSSKDDFFWTLHACFVRRPEHRIVFSQVFRLFWRDPKYLEQMMAVMLPSLRGVQKERIATSGEKRAAEALLDGVQNDTIESHDMNDEVSEIEIDSSLTMSSEERLRSLDFEQMSAEEVQKAKRVIAKLQLPVEPLRTRRNIAASKGRELDWRRTFKTAIRSGGEIQSFMWRQPQLRWPNLVVLCDISGSMSHYSRMILHFVHAVSNTHGQGWAKVHAFTFGTRLTNITRYMMHRDVDEALARAGAEAQDWKGGTRIGFSLRTFNHDWSRRVLGQGAIVLLMSDGLERDDLGILEKEMERLRLSSRRVIWLNPLLRWKEFAPKAQGIRAMLQHVDCMKAGHSINSFEELAITLSRIDDVGEKTAGQLDAISSPDGYARTPLSL